MESFTWTLKMYQTAFNDGRKLEKEVRQHEFEVLLGELRTARQMIKDQNIEMKFRFQHELKLQETIERVLNDKQN